MNEAREKHDLVLENQQLRQIIAGVIAERSGEPLSIHMSNLRTFKAARLNVEHVWDTVADEATLKITLIDPQLIGESNAG